jgi:hypothetical protein
MREPMIKDETMIQLLMLTAAVATVSMASPAAAEVIDVIDNHGGAVAQYDQRWRGLAARGVDVRVIGPCKSACTVLLDHIPRGKICVTPAASFGFHQALRPDMTALLWNGYPADVRGWITRHGGLPPPRTTLIWLRAPETYRFWRRCA